MKENLEKDEEEKKENQDVGKVEPIEKPTSEEIPSVAMESDMTENVTSEVVEPLQKAGETDIPPVEPPVDPPVEPSNNRRRKFATMEGSSNYSMINKSMVGILNALNKNIDESEDENESSDSESDDACFPPSKSRKGEMGTIVDKPSTSNADDNNLETNNAFADTGNDGSSHGGVKGKGGKKKNFDRPNFQRINMKKKSFTRFGAAQNNRKKKLLKFRKRANRFTAKREMAEAAEWGLDADSLPTGNQEGDEKQPNEVLPPQPLTIVKMDEILSKTNGESMKEKVSLDLKVESENHLNILNSLVKGETVCCQLEPPARYHGYEGWFHQSTPWSRIVATMVEIARRGEESQQGIGLVVVCDSTCPLPLPKIFKSYSRKTVKAANPNKGGAVISGEMTTDERQEVVQKARNGEVSYIICRPEMLLSSDWFKRANLPPVACVCMLFAEKALPAPWISNSSNIVTFGKFNSCNIRPETSTLVLRILSLFRENPENNVDKLPMLITATNNVNSIKPALFGKNFDESPINMRASPIGVPNKLTGCSKLLLQLAEHHCPSDNFTRVIFACESLAAASQLEQLLRQDGSIAVYLSNSLMATSQRHGISFDISRVASQDDIVQTALQASGKANKNQKQTANSSTIRVIISSVETLPHIILYRSDISNIDDEKTLTVFVGCPPSADFLNMNSQFTNDSCVVLLDNHKGIEANMALRSFYSIVGSIFSLKQIVETLLPNFEEHEEVCWNAVDVSTLAQRADCHTSLVTGILLQLYFKKSITDVAGSRQDTCIVRLYGSDPASVELFEESEILVAARRLKSVVVGEGNKGNKSLTFSMSELANELKQHPDNVRRQLYQLRPVRFNHGGRAFSQRSPFVITFDRQWSFVFKVNYDITKQRDKIIMDLINDMNESERVVRNQKLALVKALSDNCVPLAELRASGFSNSVKELQISNENIEFPHSEAEEESAKVAVECIVEEWTSQAEFTGRKTTPWSVARALHGITLPGTLNGSMERRADWLPTMRVSYNDVSKNQNLRVSFLKLVELARKAIMT